MGAPTNTWYSNIALAQAGGANVLANLQDPNLTAGRISQITAIYTMTGNEVANDVIYIVRVPSGSIPKPEGTMTGSGIATTATVSVGDTDTQGGLVAYDPARYSAAQDVHAAVTTGQGVAYAGRTTLTAPPFNPQVTAQLQGLTGYSGVSASPNAALTSWGITDDWVWLLATFATLATPVANKVLVFRQQISQLD